MNAAQHRPSHDIVGGPEIDHLLDPRPCKFKNLPAIGLYVESLQGLSITQRNSLRLLLATAERADDFDKEFFIEQIIEAYWILLDSFIGGPGTIMMIAEILHYADRRHSVGQAFIVGVARLVADLQAGSNRPPSEPPPQGMTGAH